MTDTLPLDDEVAEVDTADRDGDRTVLRIVRLVRAHVVDGWLPRRHLSSVLDFAGADHATRLAVTEAVQRDGVRLIDNGGDTPPGLSLPVAAEERRPVAVDASRAERSAMELLERDRRESAPWRRLLTAVQETGLARLVRGEMLPLDAELPRGYRAQLPPGDQRAAAFDALVLHNVRLVHSIAAGYPPSVTLTQEDLVQNGMFGLLRAVEKFNAALGLKFSTYATWWIRQAATRAIADQGTTIRIPVHVREKIQRVQTARSRLLSTNERVSLARLCVETGFDHETVQQCLRLARGVVSLDLPLTEDREGTLGDFINAPPGSGSDPEEIIDEQQLRAIVRQALGKLPERQAHVMAARHGLDRDLPSTLGQLAGELGLSREGIRQIETQAAEKLVETLAQLGIRPRTGVTSDQGDRTEAQ